MSMHGDIPNAGDELVLYNHKIGYVRAWASAPKADRIGDNAYLKVYVDSKNLPGVSQMVINCNTWDVWLKDDPEVAWAEIIEVVEKPEVIYGPDIRGRKNYQKGDLCVVVDGSGGVITVLLRQEKEWTDEEAKNRNSENHPVVRCNVQRKHTFHFYYVSGDKLFCPGI